MLIWPVRSPFLNVVSDKLSAFYTLLAAIRHAAGSDETGLGCWLIVTVDTILDGARSCCVIQEATSSKTRSTERSRMHLW